MIAQKALLISESGLFKQSDLARVHAAGANAVLIGESLMRQGDIQAGLKELILKGERRG